MKITPAYDYVVIRVRAVEKSSTGGIFLGESKDNDALIGDVLEVGPGVLLESGELCPLMLKAGDSVLLPPHIGSSLMTIAGEELAVLRAREVLGVVTSR